MDRLAILADLAQPTTRREAARRLARALGADDLIIFHEDPELRVLLPAPGFPQTLPGSAAWRSLLSAAVASGRAIAPVRPPGGDAPVECLAVAGRCGSVLVLLGGSIDEGDIRWLETLLPLLTAAFRGERAAATAKAHAEVSRLSAMQAEALALSLDKVRRELGDALARASTAAEENGRLLAEVREADARKNEFLAILAHELRNPLAPIRTGLQVLKLAPTSEVAAEAREMMERQLGHMVRLIDDLLDLCRITRGKVELRRQRVELAAVVNSAVETSLPLLEAGRHELAVSLPDEVLVLDADLTRIAQVLSNLLNNAAKYTPDGGRIELVARREGEEAIVTVRDNGLGIPREMLPQIFDMFTQVGRNLERAQGGLGIGLTLVRRLTELHGGTVTAESAGPGQGSCFTVRLPLAAMTGCVSDGTSPAPEPAPVPGRLRILVVDDNVDGARILAKWLSIRGHATHMAHSGPEALAVAADFRPDVVLLDIGLPGLNGYEVARRLRQQPEGSRIVLVALTGWGSDEDRERSREAGFDHHLTKPVEPGSVDLLLRRLDR